MFATEEILYCIEREQTMMHSCTHLCQQWIFLLKIQNRTNRKTGKKNILLHSSSKTLGSSRHYHQIIFITVQRNWGVVDITIQKKMGSKQRISASKVIGPHEYSLAEATADNVKFLFNNQYKNI